MREWLAFSWLLGASFWAGVAFGDHERFTPKVVLMCLSWPVLIVWGFVWGNKKNRRWFCWLTSHRWKDVWQPRRDGRQCQRCLLTEWDAYDREEE